MTSKVTLTLRGFCVGILLLAAAACQTIRPDQNATRADSTEIALLNAMEARLLGLRLAPDPAALASLRAELDKIALQENLGRQLVARADALRAEAAILALDTAAARKHLAAAALLSDTEEGVWLVRALLETDPAKRLAVLQKGIARAEKTSRLLCERGLVQLESGRYAQAAQDLDEGLRALTPDYARLYGAARTRAFALSRATQDARNAPLQTEGLSAPLTLQTMVERTAADTRLLSGLSADPKPTFAALLPALKNAGLLLDPAASPNARAGRKTVAYFLWGLVSRARHDPQLLTRYGKKYPVSPVPDVAVTDPWFDAVIGTVEGQIMELPDGIHFKPNDPVTGFELVGMLAKVQDSAP